MDRCPQCNGLGGYGTFGPCKPSSLSFKHPCVCCGGLGKTRRTEKCDMCAGLGGIGTFGPCELKSLSLNRRCAACGGAGYVGTVETVVETTTTTDANGKTVVTEKTTTRTYS